MHRLVYGCAKAEAEEQLLGDFSLAGGLFTINKSEKEERSVIELPLIMT